MRRVLLYASLAVTLVAFSSHHARSAPDNLCAGQLPFGMPRVAGAAVAVVCHTGYVAAVDVSALVPRWVAYRLTAEHSVGCFRRQDNFHLDELLPAGSQAQPGDYARSGYDRGHQAPAEDFAWSEAEMSDSFSMANMAPQLPGLNREEWEHLEETVRAWALARGELDIYVGPIMSSGPQTISGRVAVPVAFFKVVIDPNAREGLAFIMPQESIRKGDLRPWQVSIDAVEQQTDINLPLPAGINPSSISRIWPASISGWRAEHRKNCG